jgi:L-histidine N-alpha-methyltransferase
MKEINLMSVAGTARVASPRLDSAFARDVLQGLSRRPKTISSKYFYDERGSRLFEQIAECGDYYLCRRETSILTEFGQEIAERISAARLRVWEAGAGDGRKTEILLRQLLAHGHQCEYVPIDICARSIDRLSRSLDRRISHPSFRMRGIVGDYFRAIEGVAEEAPAGGSRNLVLFLGSNIGNLNRRRTRLFLRRLRRSLRPGDWALIGFDLKKDPHVLQRAYDDAGGITREFNFNLLDRINRELGGQFERGAFQHHVVYEPRKGRMESWLLSKRAQSVPVRALDCAFSFEAWEGIRTETSYKYDLPQIENLARGSGFIARRQFLDEGAHFVDSLWQASS